MNYILNGHEPVLCDDIHEWGHWMREANRHVGRTTVGDMDISTVFLGLDHNFGFNGGPVLFETMVFPQIEGIQEWGMERYHTWEQAETGHQAMVERCQRRIGC